MKITDMSHEDLIAFVQAMLDASGNVDDANAHVATHKATTARNRAVARDAKATPKATPKPKVDASKPRMVNPAKALDRGIRVNGERVTGRTFAVWHIDGNAKNRDSKRASVDGGSFLAITRDGLTADDAKALAEAWVKASPKARKGATVTTCEDAWVVAKA
jgi:hypothetical protein